LRYERVSKILKSDYMETIILTVILFAGVFAFWFGLRLGLRNDFPLLAVASGSMEPFLYRGDLIVVQGVSNFSELRAEFYRFPNGTVNPNPGEVVVYYDPRYGKDIYHLIVHRAVNKNLENGTWYFDTKGDASWGSSVDPWGPIREDFVIGKVIGKAPWIGQIPLFMHENPYLAIIVIILLFAALVIVDFIFPQKKDKDKDKEEVSEAIS
jgi:signal peptidase I